jgi:L-lactate permease
MIVFLVAGHLYRTQFSIGTRLTSSLASRRATFVNTWHAQLAINLGVFITPGLVWCIHHAWIGVVYSSWAAGLMQPCSWLQTIERGLSQALNGYSLIATRGLVTLSRGTETGFHAFGMYIHNDTALGRQTDQFGDTGIPFRPVIGLLGQALLGSEAFANRTRRTSESG